MCADILGFTGIICSYYWECETEQGSTENAANFLSGTLRSQEESWSRYIGSEYCYSYTAAPDKNG
jgi:hypothetical protein